MIATTESEGGGALSEKQMDESIFKAEEQTRVEAFICEANCESARLWLQILGQSIKM